MADLSINVQQDSFRVRDFLLGAALGVALSAGLIEIPKISDSVQAALNPPPDLSIQVNQEGIRPLDLVYGVTRYVQSQNALSAGLREGNVKLSETPTALRTLDPGLIQEVMRLDDFGQVDLYGLGAWVKVADQTPIAALVSGGDLSAGPLTEPLKIADTATPTLNPLRTSGFDELLHVVDQTPLASLGGLTPGLLTESLKIADVVSGPIINPEQASGFDESLKIDDFGQVDLYGLGAWVKVADQTPIAQLVSGNDLSVGPLTETLTCTDTHFDNSATIDEFELVKIQDQTPLVFLTGGTLSASGFDESLKIADTVLGPLLNPEQTSGFDESLKIADTVLGPTLNPEQATPSESLKIQDTPSTTLDPEQTSTASESLKVQDIATAVLDPLNALTLTESLKVQDTVSPALWLAVQAGDENLHVQDSVQNTLLNPLQTSGFDELIHVQDQTPNTGSNLAASGFDESLKIADIVTPQLTVLFASGFDESLKVADAATPQLTVLLASGFDESLKVQDAVTGLTLNPLQTSGFNELLHVVDQTPQVGASIAPPVLIETCKLADQVFAQLDTLLATPIESLKVVDTVLQQITPLLASGFDEQAKVSDSISESITPLLAQASESLKIEDKQPNFAGPSIIDVNGSYITKVDVGGSYIPHIDVIGQVE
jgi:hypothetical protein